RPHRDDAARCARMPDVGHPCEWRIRRRVVLIAGRDHHCDPEAHGVVRRLAEDAVGVIAYPAVEDLAPAKADAGDESIAADCLIEAVDHPRRLAAAPRGEDLDID